MNLVVDTSVLIAVIANEPEKAALVTQTQGADLFAPHSIYWEMGNAFSAMLKRQRITVEQAKAAVEVYRQIPLTLMEVDLVQAVELASQLNIYAYDAYIIACAINQDCPLLSLDAG
ncbi:MAG: type II toxin-antitoxin system VapC family toxin, partial [Armatimonadota bacterium]|nr:type II toxin-antitoxin system VapC family toxin [Armatimonadota bacterium]